VIRLTFGLLVTLFGVGCTASAVDVERRVLVTGTAAADAAIPSFLLWDRAHQESIVQAAIAACENDPAPVMCRHAKADAQLATYRGGRDKVIAAAYVASVAEKAAKVALDDVDAGVKPTSILNDIVSAAISRAAELLAEITALEGGK
jgi:hypothetical protein